MQKLLFLQRPDTVDELIEFSREAFAHNSSAIYYYGEKIVPLDANVVARLDKYKLNMESLKAENPVFATDADAYLASLAGQGQLKLVPLVCRYARGVAVYDLKRLRISTVLDIPTFLSADALDEPLPLKEQLDDHLKSEHGSNPEA